MRSTLVMLAVSLSGCVYTLKTVPDVDFTQSPQTNGLDADERYAYHRMDEGIHYLPERMLRALRRPKMPFSKVSLLFQCGLYDEPFLTHPQRLGLVTAAGGPSGTYLVGLSVSKDKGSEPMVGLNCATCHTAAMRVKNGEGKTVQVLVDGGPSNFSINRFVEEMTISLLYTVTGDFPRFYERFHGSPAEPAQLERVKEKQAKFFKTLQDLNDDDDPKEVKAQKLEAVTDVTSQFKRSRKGNRDQRVKQLSTQMNIDSEPFADRVELLASLAKPKTGSPDCPDSLPAACPLATTLESPEDVWDYMATRFLYFRAVTKDVVPGTPAGLGRSDPWSTTRTLMARNLGEVDSKPSPAPIGNAQMWTYESYRWQFWSGVTNSMLERNLAQGVALLSDYDWEKDLTPVATRKLNEVAVQARKIVTPKWPAEFGPVDLARAARGKLVFKNQCLSCHQPAQRDSYEDRAYYDVGTDPEYTKNQRQPFGSQTLFSRLETWMAKVKANAYVREGVSSTEAQVFEKGRLPVAWRTPDEGKYEGKSLAGIWAAAPYLHNGSVRTVSELLKKPAEREQQFEFGTLDYDPENLGFVDTPSDSASDYPSSHRFDVSLHGNSNRGHDFGTALSTDQKKELIEFLKVLGDDEVFP
ncbi:MAG: hypothetical protein QM817_35765 [Archangium sp.]